MSSLSVSCLVDSSPFPDYNTFENCMKLLDVADIGRVARVCKSWNKLFQSPTIWKILFEQESIPLVSSLINKELDYKGDFKTLYRITIIGKRISRLNREMIWQAPPISEIRSLELLIGENELDRQLVEQYKQFREVFLTCCEDTTRS